MRCWCVLVALTLLPYADCLRAEVIHVRDYRTEEPWDRNVAFAMAVTPEGDALSLVAKADGKYRLTRIRGWLEKKPTAQVIDVPGWPGKMPSANDTETLQMLTLGLFATADGMYVVCVVHGFWHVRNGRGGRQDGLVTVVDLGTFRSLRTVRTSELNEDAGVSFNYLFDPAGIVVLQAGSALPIDSNGSEYQIPKPVPSGLFLRREVRLKAYAVPDSTKLGRCTFSDVHRGDTWTPENENGDCRELLARITDRRDTLAQFVNAWEDIHGYRFRREAILGRCGTPRLTRDSRYKLEPCGESHLTVWNRNFVNDALWENIISVNTGKPVGTVPKTTHNTVESRYTVHNGRQFLLIFEGGVKLKVYEIIDSPPAR